MQNNFTQTGSYRKWVTKRKIHVVFFILFVQILHVFLLILGYRKLKKILDFLSKNSKERFSINEKEVLSFRGNVRHFLRYLRKSNYIYCNCFSTSLLLWFIFKKQGLENEIRIGATKIDNEFKAHAWVEINKIPLNAGLKVRQKYGTFNFNFNFNFDFDFSKRNISITSL
jgi:hypothetical protein